MWAPFSVYAVCNFNGCRCRFSRFVLASSSLLALCSWPLRCGVPALFHCSFEALSEFVALKLAKEKNLCFEVSSPVCTFSPWPYFFAPGGMAFTVLSLFAQLFLQFPCAAVYISCLPNSKDVRPCVLLCSLVHNAYKALDALRHQ